MLELGEGELHLGLQGEWQRSHCVNHHSALGFVLAGSEICRGALIYTQITLTRGGSISNCNLTIVSNLNLPSNILLKKFLMYTSCSDTLPL